MALTLAEMSEHGGELVRWQGGFWTYPKCPIAGESWPHKHRIPQWYATFGTVRALLDRGEIVILERHPIGYATRVGLNAENTEALADHQQSPRSEK